MKLHLIAALFSAIFIAGCQEPVKSSGSKSLSPRPSAKSAANRHSQISDILKKVLDTKTYSKGDRDLVEKLARSPDVVDSAMATLVWSAAANKGLADKAELLDLLVEKSVGATSTSGATLHAYQARDLVQLAVVRPDKTSASDEMDALVKANSDTAISPQERAFVERMFASKEPADLGVGAVLFTTKHDLNAADKVWVKTALDRRLSKASGPSKEFLTFVKQVVEKRSP